MFNVKIVKELPLIQQSKKITNTVERCIGNYTDDLLAVSTSRTPVDEGNLETSGSKKVTKGSSITGEVSFNATNKGFNYAVKMHEGTYKLGVKSRGKKAMRSKYANRSFSVGSKYLVGTALSCEKGYTKDLNEEIGKVLK